MTTTTLIAEARRLCAQPFVRIGDVEVPVADVNFAGQAARLIPQLADAYVALHAKVRERAILPPTGSIETHDRRYGLCKLCNANWGHQLGDEHTAHAPDCPARPMEDAHA